MVDCILSAILIWMSTIKGACFETSESSNKTIIYNFVVKLIISWSWFPVIEILDFHWCSLIIKFTLCNIFSYCPPWYQFLNISIFLITSSQLIKMSIYFLPSRQEIIKLVTLLGSVEPRPLPFAKINFKLAHKRENDLSTAKDSAIGRIGRILPRWIFWLQYILFSLFYFLLTNMTKYKRSLL